jgi:hypothetical protein
LGLLRHEDVQDLRDPPTQAVKMTRFDPEVSIQRSLRLREYEGGLARRLIASRKDVRL